MKRANDKQITLSLILPVFNAEKIIEKEIEIIHKEATSLFNKLFNENKIELLIVENGSTDRTLILSYKLAKRFPYIRVIHLENPSYGKALKTGLVLSQGDYVAIINIHFHNLYFVSQALDIFKKNDDLAVVVGSKNLKESQDKRPWIRRLITKIFNFVLYLVFKYKGSDTHGMKVLKRTTITPVISLCITEGELFDTELLILAQNNNLKIKELPVSIERVSGRSILKRIPSTLKDLYKIYKNIKKCKNKKY